MRELLAELTAALDQGRPCVYCAVVETRGSTPQKAGAAMLVFPDGTQRGTLGGGCVEAEVKQNALGLLHNGGDPAIRTFNLDDNYGWDDGLICGGRMTMLIDPLHRPEAPVYYRRFRDLVEQGQGCTEAVAIGDQAGVRVGSRFLFGPDSQLMTQLGGNGHPAKIQLNLTTLSDRPRPSAVQGIAYLPLLPRITLLIVGGGHVGQGVAKLAADVGFDVWVLDDRERYVSPERFPTACRILIRDIGQQLQELARAEITPSTYAIIVTRGHAHDEEALYHLAPTKAGYVGMIGSKRKIKLIFEDLIAKGIGADVLKRVHAPLGFDIGSQTVPEIAVSIVAELIAHRNLGPKRVER